MNYPTESRAIQRAINASRNTLVVSHANPDADAVAALLAFRGVFIGPTREITLALGEGTIPETLVFLKDLDTIEPFNAVDPDDYDLLVLLDCADEDRVGEHAGLVIRSLAGRVPVINIDHHVTNSRFGSINLIDADAAATCEILALLFEDLGVEIDASLATTLLTGIQGDTLGLRTPSTTGQTLDVSADLLRAGADLDRVVDYLFRIRPYSTLKLWAHALGATSFTGELIWTEITSQMLEDSGADESEAEGIVNFLAGTRGARAAALLYRKDDGWRVSMRSLSDEVDVSQLTSLFGGGGHSRAAGCSLTGGLELRNEFLETVASRIARDSAPVSVSG